MGQDADNDGRLSDQNAGTRRDPMCATETQIHSSTETVTHPESVFEQKNGSFLPAERLSPLTPHTPSTTTGMSSSRKRTARGASDDESAPIIRHAQDGAKDYQSISPSISARTSGAENAALGSVDHTRGAQEALQREAAEREAAEQERREGGRWRKWVDKYGSVELENKGSVARDHLALERTFLAWLRTSLSFASIGIAVTQLFRLNTTISNNSSSTSSDSSNSPQARLRHVGKPLGATFIAISILILFIGFHRYFEAQHYVIRGKFPASRGSILFVSLVAGGLIISSLVVILAVAPGAFEK